VKKTVPDMTEGAIFEGRERVLEEGKKRLKSNIFRYF